MILNSPTISGSLTVTGNIIASGSITLSGSVASASYALSASNAATASSADNFLTRGTLTAQTLVVQTITSSVDFVTGSTRFGSVIGNTHVFTGSMSVSGSGTFASSITATNGNFSVESSATNSVLDILTLTHTTSGTAASGLGAGILFRAERPSSGITLSRGAIYGVSGTDADDDGDLAFYTLRDTGAGGFNEKMRITSGGNVGIGTTTPGQLFEVVGGEIKAGRVDSSNEGGQVSFGRSTDNATAWYIDAYGNVASPQLRFVNVTNAVVAMTITGSNVGIGTSNPTQALSVYRGGGSNYLRIQGDNNSGYDIAQQFTDGTNDVYSGMMRGSTGRVGAFTVWTGGAERLSVTSAGNVVLNQKLITSFTSNPSNVSAGGTTSFSLTQPQFEYQSTYFVSIVGLYAPSGVNQNGFYTGLVTFFSDGSNAQANVSALHANGWSLAVSATTGGTFTGTFTNASGATMSNVWIRILKINKTFDN
jgi:hypothetical protein